jgi:hypothetical protein
LAGVDAALAAFARQTTTAACCANRRSALKLGHLAFGPVFTGSVTSNGQTPPERNCLEIISHPTIGLPGFALHVHFDNPPAE